MAAQRFNVAFCCVAFVLACANAAGVNGIELNSTNFAVTPEIAATKQDRSTINVQTTETERRTPSEAPPPPSKVLVESPMATMPLGMAPVAPIAAAAAVGDSISSANLTEARITSITFRSEEADVDKDNDETISFGIRSFTVEIATPPTEKPIPLNERVGAANTINVQQAAASSLPILTEQQEEQRGGNDDDLLASNDDDDERSKVFSAVGRDAPPIVLNVDSLSPEMMMVNAKNKQQEIMALNRAAAASDISSKATPTQLPVATKSGHEQLSISSNGMHVEQKLENGLYRIKIAEIITDEFNNGRRNGNADSDAKQTLDENVSNSGKNIDAGHPNGQQQQQQQQYNIADLYPSKLEDFSSIIRESNEKLIEEKNRYVGNDKSSSNSGGGSGTGGSSNSQASMLSSNRFNIIDDGNEQGNAIQFGDENALDAGDKQQQQNNNKANGAFNSIENNIPTTKIEIELIDGPGVPKDDDIKIIGPGDDDDYVSPIERANVGAAADNAAAAGATTGAAGTSLNVDKVTDFTSELQLKDDMVSKIEQSFRESSMANIQPLQIQQQQQHSITINHPINPMGFIERRVKKFDPSFKKRMSLQPGNTNTNSNGGDSTPMANTNSVDENIISQSDEERKIDVATGPTATKENEKHFDASPATRIATPIEKQSSSSINSAPSKSQLLDKNNNKVDDLVQVAPNTNANERIGVGHGINSAKKDLILPSVEQQQKQQQQPINATERKILFFNVNNNGNSNGNGNGTIDPMELERLQKHREQIIKESRNANHTNGGRPVGLSTNMHLHIMHDDAFGQKPSESIKTNYGNANKVSSSPVGMAVTAEAGAGSTVSTTVTSTTAKPSTLPEVKGNRPTARSAVTLLNQATSNAIQNQQQQQQQQPTSASPAPIDTISSTESNSMKHSSSLNSIKSPITQSPLSTTTDAPSTATTTSAETETATTILPSKKRPKCIANSTIKAKQQQQQKPFGRRGFDGFYFETECDMQTPIPSDATIWRGNETHELNLPTTVSQFTKLFTTI